LGCAHSIPGKKDIGGRGLAFLWGTQDASLLVSAASRNELFPP
jgi:hypothetical protein